jgi:dihydroneopterin aldolase
MLVESNRRMQQMLYDHARWMEQHYARQRDMMPTQYAEAAHTRRQAVEHQHARYQETLRARYQETLRARYEEMHQRLRVLAITREATADSQHPN